MASATDRDEKPSFAVTKREGRLQWKRLEENPLPLSRPLLIVSGYRDPGIAACSLKARLSSISTNPDFLIPVTLGTARSFDECADRLISAVESSFPSEEGSTIIEVDVVAFSMGGLAARDAALPEEGQRRLKIHRLFTISSPHRGASLAWLPSSNPV